MIALTLCACVLAQPPPPGVVESRLSNHTEERFERLFYDLDRLSRAGVDVRELQERAWRLRGEMSTWHEPHPEKMKEASHVHRDDCCRPVCRARAAGPDRPARAAVEPQYRTYARPPRR